jgi:hypothetical protein
LVLWLTQLGILLSLSGTFLMAIHWTASLEEDGESASVYGSVGFSDPDPATFVPFSELTKEEVLNWVFEALGVDQVISIQEALYQQIQEKINPTSEAGVPW